MRKNKMIQCSTLNRQQKVVILTDLCWSCWRANLCTKKKSCRIRASVESRVHNKNKHKQFFVKFEGHWHGLNLLPVTIKGGLISEDIFNLVPSSKKCAKSISSTYQLILKEWRYLLRGIHLYFPSYDMA